MLFNVAAYCNTPITEVEVRPIDWLFDWHERVGRSRWQDFVSGVITVEVAVMRAMSSKKPRPLPSYEEIVAKQAGKGEELPDWMNDFEAANVGRLAVESENT